MPFPPPGDLPNPGSPALEGRFLPLSHMRSPRQEIMRTSARSYCVEQTGGLRSAEVWLGKCEREMPGGSLNQPPSYSPDLGPFRCWSCFYWCLPGLFAPIYLPAFTPLGLSHPPPLSPLTPPSISHPEKTRPTSQLSQKWSQYFKRAQ